MKQPLSTRTVLLIALAALVPIVIAVILAQSAQGSAKVYSLIRIGRHSDFGLEPTTHKSKEELDEHRQALAVMAKSPFILQKVLNAPKVAHLDVVKQQQDPIAWLEKNLTVDFVENAPSILRISMKGASTETMTILVDAATDAYLSEAVLADRTQRMEAIDRLKRLVAATETDLREKRRTFNQLKQGTGPSKLLEVSAQEDKQRGRECFS